MLRIVGLFTAAAVAYGLVHDQVTARVCVEYFTVAHPRLLSTDEPWRVGLLWGLVASAPAGAFSGTLVALAARDGSGPRLDWRAFTRPVAALAAVMAVAALAAGLAGYHLTAGGTVGMLGEFASAVPAASHPRFMADVYAHLASFAVGLLGTLAIAWRARTARAVRR